MVHIGYTLCGVEAEALQHYSPEFKSMCLFVYYTLCLPFMVLQGFQPAATGGKGTSSVPF